MRRIYSVLIVLTIMYMHSEAVFANDHMTDEAKLNYEFFGREEGLSNLSVSSIVQDRYGFLWFGTQGGLNRYDGRDVVVIRNNPFEEAGLVHNLIQTMYYDEENHELWIGTYQGVSQYIIAEDRFVNYTVDGNNLSNPIVIAITKDLNGDMWFGTMNGLNRLVQETGTFENFAIPGEVVRALLMDSTQRLLIGTYEGLRYFDFHENLVKSIPLDLPSPNVMVVKEFKKGTVTLGLWGGGVVEVNMETNTLDLKSYEDDRVYSLIQTEDETLWVGTWGGGLFTEDIYGEVTHYASEDEAQALSHNIVYSIYQDHSGIVWIGTNGGGINKMNPRKNNFVSLAYDPEDEHSLNKGKINKVFEDSEGKIWVAIYDNGLNVYVPQQNTIVKYTHESSGPNPLPHNQVNDIYEYGDNLLFGTNAGLVTFDRLTGAFSMVGNLPQDIFIYAIEKVNEDELWLGTHHNGLFIYNMVEDTYVNYKSDDLITPVADNLIYDIHMDSVGRIWLATNNGLNMKEMDSDSFQLYQKEKGNNRGLANNIVRLIYEDSKGILWFGMLGGGVAYYSGEEDNFVSFTEHDGMPSNIVTGIVEDQKGGIWAATDNGISIIQPDEREIFYLTPDDGIGGWEFSSNAIKTEDGSLLFGGVHGITRIPSHYTSIEIPEPRVYITDVLLFQEPVNEKRQFFNDTVLEFGPKDSYLEFKVVALDFDTPSDTRFSYKLEGFDEEWINAGTRNYISYSNLPAGDYTLKVICKTARNVVSEPASLKFSIAAAWYQTTFAYMAYILIFVIVVNAIVKLREGKFMAIRNVELAVINGKLETANVQLEQLSIKDQLTGLYNRRYFDVMFADHMKLAIRGNTHLSLIIIDIDDFKQVNDKFGHMAGDCLLIDVAEVVSRIISRATDFSARYGGDELVVVLYDTDSEDTLFIANKILEELRKIKVRDAYASESYFITASIGIAFDSPKVDCQIEDYINAADKALYTSKKSGRNCINIKTNIEKSYM